MNLFLLNPQSQRANTLKNRIKKYLEDLRIPGDFIEVKKAEDLNGIVKKAVEEKVEKIIAIGGDGMINRIIPLIVKTDTILCVIPVGETNFFANIIGLKNWKDGCKNLIRGELTEINLGRVNSKYFLSSVEIDPKGKEEKTKSFLWFSKKNDEQSVPVSISIKSENVSLKLNTDCYSILISTMPIRMQQKNNDSNEIEKDDLNIIIKSKTTHKSLDSKKTMSVLQGQIVDIQSKSPMNIKVDGDKFGKTPALIEKTNHKLKLLKYNHLRK